MPDKKTRSAIRTALSLLLVGLYVAGLIAMVAFSFELGLYLWVISTVGGLGLLYWIRTMNKREQDAEAISRGVAYGEPDDPIAGAGQAVPEEEARSSRERDDS